MNLGRVLIVCVSCAAAGAVFAQSPRSSRSGRAPAPVTVPRPTAIADRAAEVRDWMYYESMRELPPDVRELLARVSGGATVDEAEAVDQSDEAPANTLLHFAAVGGGFTVLALYANGGIVAARMHLLIYDQAAGDACRYVLSRDVRGGATQLPSLLHSIRQNGADRVVRVEYLEPDALKRR